MRQALRSGQNGDRDQKPLEKRHTKWYIQTAMHLIGCGILMLYHNILNYEEKMTKFG
jgi:hypothetical protein